MCISIGTPEIFNFPFETDGTLIVLGVPVLKLIRLFTKVFVQYSDLALKRRMGAPL